MQKLNKKRKTQHHFLRKKSVLSPKFQLNANQNMSHMGGLIIKHGHAISFLIIITLFTATRRCSKADVFVSVTMVRDH